MKLYPLRKRIREDFLVGTFITVYAPDLVESMGSIGFDFVCLESEHSAFGMAQLENLIRAANLADLPAIVRVAELGPEIARTLDMGAAGVIVPRIETVEEAREVVRRSRYTPEGERGSGPGRATDYGARMQSYLESANDNLLVIIQIETARGLQAVEEIVAVPGIDGVCVGPFDLALSTGHPPGSRELIEAISQINTTAKRQGLATVTVAPAPEVVARAREGGDNMVIYGADRMFFTQGAQQMLAAAGLPADKTGA